MAESATRKDAGAVRGVCFVRRVQFFQLRRLFSLWRRRYYYGMAQIMDRNELSDCTGKNIREQREFADMSQQTLADLAGIHRVTLTRIECGNQLPDFDVVCRIADTLKVSVDSLRRKNKKVC